MQTIEAYCADLHSLLRSLTHADGRLRELGKPPPGNTPEEELRYLFGLWNAWITPNATNPVEDRAIDLENQIKLNASRTANAFRNVMQDLGYRIQSLLEGGTTLPEFPVIPTAIFADAHGRTLKLGGRLALGLIDRLPAGHWLHPLLPEADELLEVDNYGAKHALVLGPLGPHERPLPFYALQSALAWTHSERTEQKRLRCLELRRKEEMNRLESHLPPEHPGYRVQQLEQRVAALEGRTDGQEPGQLGADAGAPASDPMLDRVRHAERFAASLREQEERAKRGNKVQR